MKKVSRVLSLLLVVMLLVSAPVSVFATPRRVNLKASGTKIYVGATKKLSVRATRGSKIYYRVSNNTVVVSKNGTVKGRRAGTAKVKIVAKRKGYKSATKTVTVKVVKRNQKVNARNVTVSVGKSASLGASAKTGLKFKSSNTKVATVNSKGVVVGKKVGTVKITVYTKGNGTYNKASRTVTIKVIKPAHKHSYKKTVIPAKTHKVEHKEEGHWVEPTWVVDKPAITVVDVPEHDAYVCTDGTEFETEELAKAHVDEVNAQHVIASKVNKVIHHDAVPEVSHQEMVTPEEDWYVCDGPNGTGCGFATPDESVSVAHTKEFVNKNTEIARKYFEEGYSQDEAIAKANAECPIHDISHVCFNLCGYETCSL